MNFSGYLKKLTENLKAFLWKLCDLWIWCLRYERRGFAGKFVAFGGYTSIIKIVWMVCTYNSHSANISPLVHISNRFSFLNWIKIGMFILHAKKPSRIWSIVNQNFACMLVRHRNRRVIMAIRSFFALGSSAKIEIILWANT